MKILCIANVRLPSERAYGVALMRQCEAFATLGHTVTFAYARRRNAITQEPFAYYGVKPCFSLKRIWVCDALRFGKFGTALTILSFLPGAVWVALREKPDVIFTRDDFTGAFLSLFFKNVVWEVHTARTSSHLCLLRRRAKAVVYISQGLRAYYANRCGGRVKKELVAPSAISLEAFQVVTESKDVLRTELGVPVGAKVVGYVGKMTTMGEGKGVDTLVEAFAHVYRQYPDAFLLLVGADGRDMPYLEGEMQKNPVPVDAYRIVPHVAQSLVPRYMKVCDCLVLCYPDTEHYRLYMSPIKLFEYRASGVPVVATDLPSVREVAKESDTVFVAPNDAVDMARGIVEGFARTPHASPRPDATWTWEKRGEAIIKLIHTIE